MNNRNTRDTRPASTSGGGNKPWNVSYCRNYKDGEGKEQTQFLLCGVAFPMRNREGFSVDLFFELQKGDRLVIMPREEREDRDR